MCNKSLKKSSRCSITLFSLVTLAWRNKMSSAITFGFWEHKNLTCNSTRYFDYTTRTPLSARARTNTHTHTLTHLPIKPIGRQMDRNVISAMRISVELQSVHSVREVFFVARHFILCTCHVWLQYFCCLSKAVVGLLKVVEGSRK